MAPPVRRELDLGTRVAALLLGTAIVYNLALLGAYVAHFEGQMGIEAHSYFRYNTHLGLLLMAALVLYARDWRWQQFGGRWRRAMPALVVLLALSCRCRSCACCASISKCPICALIGSRMRRRCASAMMRICC